MDKIDIDLNEFDKWAGGLPPEIVRKIQLLIGDPKDFSDKGLFDWLLKVGKSQIGDIVQAELDKRASKLDAECNEKYAEKDGFKVCRFGYKFEDLNQFEKMCRLRLDAPKTKFKCEGGTRITQNRLEFTVAPRRLIKEFEFKNNRELIANGLEPSGAISLSQIIEDYQNVERVQLNQLIFIVSKSTEYKEP